MVKTSMKNDMPWKANAGTLLPKRTRNVRDRLESITSMNQSFLMMLIRSYYTARIGRE